MHNYKIILSDYVKYSIIIFVENLKIKRIERYIDSGLENILLTSEFDKYLDVIYDEIFEYLENKLSTGMLGTIQEKGENFYRKKVVFDIRSYNIVLNCRQYLKKGVIIVEDIRIN